ncbi:MAG: alpha/beta hydrolase-fold protein [Verrucomicrobiota bacterium]
MNREYHRWHSPNLEREMELLVFGHAGAKVLVFPTRDGRFFEYENIGMVQALKHKLDQGHIQLYCVDSVDHEGLYCFWKHPADRIRRHLQFEEYILKEVVPFMDSTNPSPCTISHGCSLGAFHAVNIAFRHPHLFQKVTAFSGRYDLTLSVEVFQDLFDGYFDENVYFHNPSRFLPNLLAADFLDHLRNMDIVLTIGREDPFLNNNVEMSQVLTDKSIHHALHIWDGRAHRASAWRRMAALYI